jgi:PAS domain S-box-containing protein
MTQKPSYKQLEQRVRELENQTEQLKQGEERYRLILEASPVSIFGLRDGCIIFANPAGARMLGFSDPNKMVGIPAMDIIAPESQQLITERIQRLESGKDNPPAEIGLIRQDGIRIIAESTSVSIRFGGKPTAAIIAQDISDRKEKEKKLQMMQFSIDKALDRIAWIAPDGRFLYANEAACKEMAYTHDEVLSMCVSDIDPGFPPEKWAEHYKSVKKKGSMRLEAQQVAGDGKIHDIEISSNVLKLGDREFMCSFERDITERKQYENEIKQYKHIIESTNNPIGLVGWNYIYQYVNDPYCQALNKSADEIIGRSVTELFGRNFFETIMEPHYKKCFAGENVNYQEWFDFPGWGRRYMDVRYYPYRESDGRVTAVVTNVHDITEIKQLDMDLKESQERFRTFMDNIPASVYIKDENDIHIYANPSAFESVKKKPEEFLGSTTRDFWPPDIADMLIELDRKVLSEDIPRITEEWSTADIGETLWRRDIKFPIKLESGKKLLGGIAIDITENKQAEQALAEQLEFEKVIADIAAQLAQTGPEQLADSINSTLQALGQFLNTERTFFAKFSESDNRLDFTNVWAAEGFSRLSKIFQMNMVSEIPWVAQHIRSGGVLKAGHGLSGLPEEAKALRSQLEKDGINSGVIVPVQIEGRSIGLLGLDTVDQPRDYPQPIVDRLKLVANMIGATLQRVRSQQTLIEQLQFQDLISKLSAGFINIRASEIDKNIERGLQLVVQNLGLDRGNLFEFSRDHKKLMLTHSSAREGVKHSPRILYSSQQPWFTGKLLDGEIVCFSQPAELPNEAQAEKEYLLKEGIQSAMIFPLEAVGVVQGGITLSSLRRERKWSEAIRQRCKLLTQIFSNALLRKRADDKIGEAFAEIKQLKERLEQENIYLREEIEVNYRHEEIIGKSKPVMEMLNRAEQVAETDSTVLILGETGTGKELLARSIHKLSKYKNRQMVKVNCAALPTTLIESELFGRERGAYTGAMTRQIGRFEIADGSTIFLDEIGELPLDVQAKLLRVLQEGQFERLGNPQTISVNVRIIASTNRDLAKAVSEGKFREDLYYRLNVFPINAPPLRDRVSDIPLLVWTFVKEFEKGMGKTIEKIPQKSLDALQLYPWPGNIRELRNVIENAMIISTGKTLKLIPPISPSPDGAKNYKLEVVEREHIIDVLEKTSWRVSGEKGAAKLLGLKPTTLESRMKKLGITRPR